MIGKSSLACILIVMLGLMFYGYSNPSIAVSSPPASPPVLVQQPQTAFTFSYAQLTVADDRYIFDEGGREVPRARSLTALVRFLGSNQRPTFVNLLNSIGSRGWELVETDTDQSVMLFKRRL